MPQRAPVKPRTLSRRESNVERLRSECSERFSKDRQSLRERLRGDADSVAFAIREGINSVRSLSAAEDGEDSVSDSDIDRLVSEFIGEIFFDEQPDPGEFAEGEEISMEMESRDWHKDWVKCPVCPSGWLAVPVPGLIACDACEMKTPLSSESATDQDFAALLDASIQQHQECGNSSRIEFSFHKNVLFMSCNRCGTLPVVLR